MKGQQRLELDIVRKDQAAVEIDRASGLVEGELPLLGAFEPSRRSVGVAHREGREIDQHPPVRIFRNDLATPQHGPGK